MLIILTGLETIHKKFFAKRLIAKLNSFNVESYSIDFTESQLKAYDATGNLVYQPNNPDLPGVELLLTENSLSTEEVAEILKQDPTADITPPDWAVAKSIIDLQESLNESIKINHFANIFCDPLADFGFSPAEEIFDPTRNLLYLHDHTYQTVLDHYRDRSFDNFVITGVFSKLFINKIKEDLGSENVKVINIIRNPSVCFLLNEKEPAYYFEKPERSPLADNNKLEQSLLNAIIVKNVDGVLTLKYEDILRDGSFEFNGITIPMPEDYTNYNNIITTWEHDNWLTLNIVSAEQLVEKNNFYSNFRIYVKDSSESIFDPNAHTLTTEQQQTLIDEFNTEHNASVTIEQLQHLIGADSNPPFEDLLPIWNAIHKTNITAEQVTATVPSNLFQALGYDPLSYSSITAPRE
jgi:hypothetical protein